MKNINRLAAIFTVIIILISGLSINSKDIGAKNITAVYPDYLPIQLPEPIMIDTQAPFIVDDVLDSILKNKLEDVKNDTLLEIIVQFKNKITANDIQNLLELNFQVVRKYTVISGVYCIGTKGAIETLAENDRVFWIELNEQLEYSMQETTTVINATKVWNSDILNFNQQNLDRIDGTGITVVVLDSGIDAGHPDLDYGTKTIMNLKSDNGNPPWIEMENSDTSSGHGTHCAGTVSGNGDASGGARRGVAPGANLIGLSVGEMVFITGAIGGLDWVYTHSMPGSNSYNIRVVSNSWGAGGGEYDPQDSISQAAEKITYENNVAVVFAAGNSGGDGSDIQCSNYGNTPAIICVAALEHNGKGVAEFSSRGQADLNGTWPDVGSPGVRIWSTAARRTLISTMDKNKNKGDFNPYYFAISGTSMATPHIAGICALLWQAYPGLRTSNFHEDYNGEDYPDWWNLSNTMLHEVELILEAAADYIEPDGENGVPEEGGIGWTGEKYDFAQGYGLVMVDRAVAIALTLKELRTRDFDHDGVYDYPAATVKDAIRQYNNITMKNEITRATDSLETQWKGDWVRFNNQTTNVIPYYTDESHFIYIPEQAKTLILTLSFTTLQTNRPQIGTLSLVIDANKDGDPDWSQPINADENKVSVIDLDSSELSGSKGDVWVFNIRGHGIVFPIINIIKESQYYEARIPYTASAVLILDQSGSSNITIEYSNLLAAYGQWEFAEPSPEYSNITITMERFEFDLSQVQPMEKLPIVSEKEEQYIWPWILIGLLLLLIILAYLYSRRKKKRSQTIGNEQ